MGYRLEIHETEDGFGYTGDTLLGDNLDIGQAIEVAKTALKNPEFTSPWKHLRHRLIVCKDGQWVFTATMQRLKEDDLVNKFMESK